MKPYFDQENLETIKKSYGQIDREYKDLLLKYVMHKFSSDEAREYATQGLMRRIHILYRCIFNVFEISPPENMKPLSKESSADLSINLQSFILNVFGSLDNIAWIWAKEKSLDFGKREIGLKPKYKKLRDTLPCAFKDYLSNFDSWFEYLENYRDALAHRIPLYVPPFALSKDETEKYHVLDKKIMAALLNQDFTKYESLQSEQESLGRFYPWMTHSYIERSIPVVFHAQILADWATIIEISNKFYDEISSQK